MLPYRRRVGPLCVDAGPASRYTRRAHACPRRVAVRLAAVLSLAAVEGAPQRLAAQPSLGERVEAVRDGRVRWTTPALEGVCGYGRGWSRSAPADRRTRDADGEVEVRCEPGPVRLVVERRAGGSTRLRTYVGGDWRVTDSAVTDLGEVAPGDAIAWLLRLAEGAPEDVATDALAPLTIIAADVPWHRVLAVARDDTRPRPVRRQALFWAAQVAGDKASAEIGAIARTDPDREIRTQAVFALSRRADGVDQLLRIARESTDRDVKQAAFFWLGQSKDPRALALFEDVLAKP